MRCILAGMDQKYSFVGVAWWETVVVPQLQFIEDRRLPLRAAETALHCPAISEDHGVSSVADGVDDATTRFLLKMALLQKKEEAKKEKELP